MWFMTPRTRRRGRLPHRRGAFVRTRVVGAGVRRPQPRHGGQGRVRGAGAAAGLVDQGGHPDRGGDRPESDLRLAPGRRPGSAADVAALADAGLATYHAAAKQAHAAGHLRRHRRRRPRAHRDPGAQGAHPSAARRRRPEPRRAGARDVDRGPRRCAGRRAPGRLRSSTSPTGSAPRSSWTSSARTGPRAGASP